MIRASNPQDTAFVVNFSDRAYLDQGFTSDPAAIERGLSHIESQGMTALYDAVSASADELSGHAKWPEQVLLIVTDGQDDASRLTLEQTIRRVQQMGGPVVYAIGLLYEPTDAKKAQQAHDVLETLAAETGGLAYFPKSLDEVDNIAEEVARDIRNEYVVGYNPPGPVAIGFHEVRVEAQAQGFGKLTVRTRRGYYHKAPTPAPKQAAQAAPAPDAK
jgi:Ca-activated chloride channel homolog